MTKDIGPLPGFWQRVVAQPTTSPFHHFRQEGDFPFSRQITALMVMIAWYQLYAEACQGFPPSTETVPDRRTARLRRVEKITQDGQGPGTRPVQQIAQPSQIGCGASFRHGNSAGPKGGGFAQMEIGNEQTPFCWPVDRPFCVEKQFVTSQLDGEWLTTGWAAHKRHKRLSV